MADMRTSLVIEALVKGVSDVSAMTSELSQLAQEAGVPLPDSTQELRAGAQQGAGDVANLGGAATQAAGDVEQIGDAAGQGAPLMAELGGAIARTVAAAAGLGAIAATLKGAIEESATADARFRMLEGVVQATGGAAGLTAEEIRALAKELDLATLGSVEGFESAAGALLTFRSVSGDAFRRALELSQDLASVMGGDAKSAAMQLGKALEDPDQGLTALTRSGVTLTEQQREQIKIFIRAGETAQAHALILDVVAGQVGGVAKAMAGGLAGAQDTVAFRWTELQRAAGDAMSPRLIEAANAVAGGLTALAENLDTVIEIGTKAGAVMVTAFAIHAANAIRAYIVQLIAAQGATVSLTAATATLGAALARIAPLLRTLGYAAIAVEAYSLTSSLVELRAEYQRHAEIAGRVTEAQARVRDRLAGISQQTGVTVLSMDEMNQAVDEGRLHFDGAVGAWAKGPAPLKDLGDQAGATAEDIETLEARINGLTVAIRGNMELTQSSIRLAIEQERTALSLAEVTGDLVAASESRTRIAELELELSRRQNQAAIDEAGARIELAQAKYKEALRTGENVAATEAELTAAADSYAAKVQQAEITEEVARRTEELSESTRGLIAWKRLMAQVDAERAEQQRQLIAQLRQEQEELGRVGRHMDQLRGGIGSVQDTVNRFHADMSAMGTGMAWHVNNMRRSFQELGPAAAATFEAMLKGARDVFGPAGLLTTGPASPLAQMRTKMEALRQETQAWTARLADAGASVADVDGALRFMSASAIRGFTNVQALGEQDLRPLRDALADAQQRLADIRDEARDTLASLRDELDQLEGDYADIEARRARVKLMELEAKLAEARAAQDRESIAALSEAIRLQEQINALRLQEARDRERNGTTTTTTGTRTGGGSGGVTGSDAGTRTSPVAPYGNPLSGGGITINIQGDALDAEALARRLQPELTRLGRFLA
jgi:hypothetical protein